MELTSPYPVLNWKIDKAIRYQLVAKCINLQIFISGSGLSKRAWQVVNEAVDKKTPGGNYPGKVQALKKTFACLAQPGYQEAYHR
jgi:hypothetical protein